jgi:hypothetical protein
MLHTKLEISGGKTKWRPLVSRKKVAAQLSGYRNTVTITK